MSDVEEVEPPEVLSLVEVLRQRAQDLLAATPMNGELVSGLLRETLDVLAVVEQQRVDLAYALQRNNELMGAAEHAMLSDAEKIRRLTHELALRPPRIIT